jgi:hypothetical protein
MAQTQDAVTRFAIRAVFMAQVAVGHGDEHPGGEHSAVEDFEEFTLGVSQGQGSGFQVLDVSL